MITSAHLRSCSAVVLLPLGLVACGEVETSAAAASASPTVVEQACLVRVSEETNNGDVTILDSTSAESDGVVIVGVGPDRAPWRCASDSEGNVSDVMFMGSEGAL